MIRVLSIVGTRPEAIKMVPVIQELRGHPDRIRSRVCVTAQHRHLLDQALALFGIAPDHDLDIMNDNQTPVHVMRAILERLEPVLRAEQPDWILVQGDTTTVMTTALLAYHHHIRVGHIEAGLRTGDKQHPFPEEINRRLTDVLADLYFAPTEGARANLLREGVDPVRIRVTGNTVVDALQEVAARPYDWNSGPLAGIPRDRRLILVTAHRRENFGAPLEAICGALRDLAERYAGDVHLVYPVHPNPNVAVPVHAALGGLPGLTLLPPLDYLPLVHLLRQCTLALTDSGGLQEEAPTFGVPVLVLRDKTERPEAVQAGAARVVGADRARIVAEVCRLLDDPGAHARMAQARNPFGDGHAAIRIVRSLLEDADTLGDSPS